MPDLPRDTITIAVIQARMSSSRLPGKPMMDLHGKPMLQRIVERVQKTRLVQKVVVATTTDASDDHIEAFCQSMNYPLYRGNMHDVLDRYYQAAKIHYADVVVRITSDCPLIDPDLIDKTIDALQKNHADFSCNRLPPPFTRTYPIGLDVEVATFMALEHAWNKAVEKHQREHVMPYLYETSGKFKVIKLDYKKDLGSLRWTVDTAEDLAFVRAIFAKLRNPDTFTWLEVLDLVQKHPEIAEINANIKHKTYLDIDERNPDKK